MTITILKPRLDVMFKKGPVPSERGPLSPIRQHWENFVKKLTHHHHLNGDQVRIIERPLWQMDQDWVFHEATQSNLIYIPHRQHFEHPLNNAKFYMQTVFPEYFTIDDNGWGAHMSYIPMDLDGIEPDEDLWKKLTDRIENNVSKFDQPQQNHEVLHLDNYWLFLCQIPHDLVIQQSSKVSVADALRMTIELARDRGQKVVIKPHPVNPGAMAEFYKIFTENKDICWWLDKVSIHTAIKHSEAVFLVNSGTGFEAMLHGKPIVTFGDAEYSSVVNPYQGSETELNMDIVQYKRFMTAFINKAFYTG